MAKGGSEPVDAGREGQEVAGEYRRAMHMGTADPDHADAQKLEARGEPGAWRRARPVRRAGRGNRPRDNLGTAPRPDPYVRHEAPLTERRCKGSAAGLSQQPG
jgi:hypothetical protein